MNMMKQKNILFIMTDQLRWDGLGVTGGWVNTPHLDQLAAEGMLFENCVTNAPACIPARAALATGLYPHNSGVWENMEYDLPLEADTWMKRLQKSGYRTSLFGKSHLHHHEGDLRDRQDWMNTYGFDHVDEIAGPRRCMIVGSHMTEMWEKEGLWEKYIEDYKQRFATKPHMAKPSALPLEKYADVYVGQTAKQYLENYVGDEPWFCMVSFGGPHEPWDAPEPYASMYDPKQMPKPIAPSTDNLKSTKGLLHEHYEAGNRHSPEMSLEEIARMRANYAGNVTLIDDQIGEIFQVLREKGEWDNTVIVFVSDHGEMNGDHGLIYKENFLQGAIKVPLIIRAPETVSKPGTRYPGMVEWMDLGPTLCELAKTDMDPRNSMQFGKSLVDVLHHPERLHREDALVENHREIMIQNIKYKMALNREGAPYLLFDLENDPDEQHNLVEEAQAEPILRQMKDKLLQRLAVAQTQEIREKKAIK